MGRSAAARQGQRKGDFLAGKYLLEDCLGIGGMGEVYRATNVSLGRQVAIKLLWPEYVNIEEDVLRFLREARAAAGIRHSNVVDVLDVARDDDGTPFIVQELLAGEDLEQYLKTRGRGRLSPEEVLEIMIPVADAVAAAHAQDVVHRDLKPANIFLARDRNKITPKVLDFGACLFPTLTERSAKEVRMLIGTPHYMAPEQIVSKADVDARSDVWALGIILYEMLVGETPFEAETADDVLKLVKTRDVPPLREQMRDASPELEELIAQCTKRDRLARLANGGAVLEKMEAIRRQLRGMKPASRTETVGEMPASDAKLQVSKPRDSERKVTANANASAGVKKTGPGRPLDREEPVSNSNKPKLKLPPSTPNLPAAAQPPPSIPSLEFAIPPIPTMSKKAPSLDEPLSSRRIPKRNAALLTLSSPGSEPPLDRHPLDLDLPPLPVMEDKWNAPSKTEPSARPPKVAASDPANRMSPPTPMPASSPRRIDAAKAKAPPPPRSITPMPSFPKANAGAIYDPTESTRSLFGDHDSSGGKQAEVNLAARPSSWPPPPGGAPNNAPKSKPEPNRRAPSSIPPVLDPRSASSTKSDAKDTARQQQIERDTRTAAAARDSFLGPPTPGGGIKSRAVAATAAAATAETSRTARMDQGWSRNDTIRFIVLVALPALVGFVAILILPPFGTPIGRALRGDSTLASGVLAVIALIAGAALCARAFLGERDRWMYVAAAGGVLFGIVMIIVTFSASEAAELGVPSSMSGLSTLIAPIAPLALAFAALGKARASWIDPYAKSEAIRAAALASLMLFLALALSPMGAVRTPTHAPGVLRGLIG